MGLISLVLVLIAVGFLLWLLETHVPIDPTVKVIVRAVVIFVLVVWLIQLFVGDIPLPHLHR